MSHVSLVSICPAIPFAKSFERSFGPGYQLYISGHINRKYLKSARVPRPREFSVNLVDQYGVEGDNRIFQFNPRFDEQTVVINSSYNRVCGPELKVPCCPFHIETNFTIIIRALPTAFQIFINGLHFVDAVYRHPATLVTRISVEGMVVLHQVICSEFDATFPTSLVHRNVPINLDPQFPIYFRSLRVPIAINIPHNMKAGMIFAIVGKPFREANLFDVSWMDERSAVALLFSVSLGGDESSVIVCNAKMRDKLTMETRYHQSLFKRGTSFRLFVKALSDSFDMWVNGNYLCNFPHRFENNSDPIDVNAIRIEGDVEIKCIKITY